MTVGGASGSPAVFQGEASRQGAGGTGALTPYPRFPAAAIPPRIEETGRERYLQNPWKGGIPVVWRMHLGVTHGSRKGRGQGIDPFPDVSRRHAAPRRGNRQGKVFAKSMERRDPSGLANASWGHTRGPPGAGWGIGPLPEVSRRHTAPRRGNRQGRYLQNPWRGGIPVAWQMHLGVTHGGRKGRGRGIDPLTWASRHRRGGLPIRSSEGGRPHMGQGGI